MEERNQRIAIIIAIIGVIGTLGAALLQNWDKIVGRPPAVAAPASVRAPGAQPAAAAQPAPAASAPAAAIAAGDDAVDFAGDADFDDTDFADDAEPMPSGLNGIWRELYPNPGNLTYTTQSGNGFRFTMQGTAQGLPFQSRGSGTLQGTQFESSYQTSLPSTGVCQGTVSDGGRRIDSVCFDSAFGRFEAASVRQ